MLHARGKLLTYDSSERSTGLLSTKQRLPSKFASKIRLTQGSKERRLAGSASPTECDEITRSHITSNTFQNMLVANVNDEIFASQSWTIVVDSVCLRSPQTFAGLKNELSASLFHKVYELITYTNSLPA